MHGVRSWAAAGCKLKVMSIEIQGMTPLIQVFNISRSLKFYRDILGFEVVSDSGDGDNSSWVWLRLNGCGLMLNDQYEPGNVPETPPVDRVEWHSDTCLYFACADVDGAYDFLQSKDVAVDQPTVTAYGMKQLHLRDPDNYCICFQWHSD